MQVFITERFVFFCFFFSSPEPKAPGELIVLHRQAPSLSVVRQQFQTSPLKLLGKL